MSIYNWARKRNQQWIAVSEHNRGLIRESFHLGPGEVLRIYNGTTAMPEGISPNDGITIRREVRQELGLPEHARLVLTVARLDIQKGHDELIVAIPHLVRDFPDVWFLWAGDGDRREALEGKIRDHHVEKKVLLLGHRRDVARLMIAADLFVLPTRYEGHPFSVLEAANCGLPVVVTNASGIPEIVEAGTTGMMTRVGDSCELLEAIRWSLQNPEAMHAMAARAKLRTREFTEEKMIEETLGVLRQLARLPHQR